MENKREVTLQEEELRAGKAAGRGLPAAVSCDGRPVGGGPSRLALLTPRGCADAKETACSLATGEHPRIPRIRQAAFSGRDDACRTGASDGSNLPLGIQCGD